MTDPHAAGEQIPICDYENSTYRTDFWSGQGREYEDGVERVALRRLIPPRGQRLLDIGAGFGRLADMYEGYDQVVLLDYSRSQLEYARSQLGDERFVYVAADIYQLPLATAVLDTVIMVRVLHHIANVPAALAHVRRVLRNEGAYVLEFANKKHLKNVFRFLVRKGVNPFDLAPYEFADLHYDFHPRWVARALEQAGFKVERRLAVSSLRFPLLKRIFPTSFLVRIDAMLQGITAPMALSPSMFVKSRAYARAGRAGSVVCSQAIFRCPACGCEPLEAADDAVTCRQCGAEWPVINGVHVFK